MQAMQMQGAECNFNAMHPQQQQLQHQQEQQQQMLCPQQYPHIPEPHAMPMPTEAPWNIDSMPWKLATTNIESDGVMRFCANINNQTKFDPAMQQRRAQLHQKRKSNLNESVPLPTKQFISEEKITAHFNGLHISSDYIQDMNSGTSHAATVGSSDDNAAASTSGKCFTNLTYQDYQITAKELEEKLKNANRITVCNEIIKMHEEQKKISFLPEALLNRITKPCTALVLWQPPTLPVDLPQQTEASGDSQSLNTKVQTTETEDPFVDAYDDEFLDPDEDAEIDDYIDNNNTCRLDFNNLKSDGMDEDL